MNIKLLAGVALAFASANGASAQSVVIVNDQKVIVSPPNRGQKPVVTAPVFIPPPPPLVGGSDSCATPDAILGAGPFGYDISVATTGTQGQVEPLCQPFAGGPAIYFDVWFVWTASFTANARIQTCGMTTLDSKIAVYPAGGCPTTGSALGCNDDACASLQTIVSWPVTNGTQYLIQFGKYGAGTPTAGATGSFTITAETPPANDVCTTPQTVVGSGPFSFDNSFATAGTQGQTDALCGAGAAAAIPRDVWYTWNATFSGQAIATTCGGTTLDTKLAVYSGTGCPSGSALACSDNACGNQSAATFTSVQGQNYTIQLGLTNTGTTGGPGTFRIDLAPPNDDCSAPIAIAGPGVYSFDSSLATTGTQGQNESLCSEYAAPAIAKDLWYTWTPSLTGTATVTTCGFMTAPAGGADTKIAVYDGAGCPTSAAIACNDDEGNTPTGGTLTCSAYVYNSTLSFNTVCGHVYAIQMGQYPFNAGNNVGAFSISETGNGCNPAVAFCFGDGSGTACPCANVGAPGNGCASSINANGGNIAASGTASIANDTVVLAGTGLSNSTCLYFQGTLQSAGGAGAIFGDGLRCVAGTVIRLGTKQNVNFASQYPSAGDLSISMKGLVAAGNLRHYQCWYRNSAAFCTISTFNLTNGVSINWMP